MKILEDTISTLEKRNHISVKSLIGKGNINMFIRTKDGIYEIEQVLTNGINLKCEPVKYSPKINVYLHRFVNNEKIVKKAETIEELSDCFVAIDKNGNLCENPMVAKGHCFKSFCNYYKAKKIDVDCYLAILTSKGLIFVAKTNEKGEPKLC